MSDKQLMKYTPMGASAEITLTPSIVKRYLVSGTGTVSDQDVMMYMMLCRNAQLDPFRREAYLIKYSNDPSEPATVVIGKDTFTKRAEAAPDYRGMQAGVIVERDGEIVEQVGSFTRASDKILGGWAKVWKADREVPYYVTVAYDEYYGRKRDGSPTKMWKEKPATMIRKVALMQALREAFPDSLGGMYDASEMSHVDVSNLPTNEVPKDVREEKVVTPEQDAYERKEPVEDERVGEEPDGADEAFGEPDQAEIF